MSLDELPDLLQVSEAARVLRISRSSAYAHARTYELSGGRDGLPVIRIGRTLRVPKTALLRVIDGGSLTPDGHIDAA